jgi:4-hydroxy-tetrahydrodipicolinate synthase
VNPPNDHPLLAGALTAVVTPFMDDGGVDHDALTRIVEWQIDSGIDGLAPCGTTGEGATLSPDEQQQVIRTVVRAAAGRVPVVAGCGSNDTRRTVQAAARAAEVGADALLVVTPYYNKPNPSGMLAHYEAVAAASDRPLVVYNVPGRTGQDLGAEHILRLAGIPGVIAVKEASANLDQMGAVLEGRSPGFAVLSGDDSLALPGVALGAEGLISVASNVAPAEMSQLVRAAANGDLATARRLHYRLLPLLRANFIETNPVPIKQAMAWMGHCSPQLRPPLGPLAPDSAEVLREALSLAGLTGVRI